MTPLDDSPPVESLHLLTQRRSVPSRLLSAPGPTDTQLQRWLEAALRVPDHGKLTPWRFVLIRGEHRLALGSHLQALTRTRQPDASEAVLAKERDRFTNAPLVVAVVSRTTSGHKVPLIEQQLSAGCVCFALLLAAQAEGFGAQWLTGWAAYDRDVAALLGLAANETVLGFIHIGTPRDRTPERERPALATLLSEASIAPPGLS